MSLDCTTERSPRCVRLALLAAMVAIPCFGQSPQSEAGNIRVDVSVTEHGQVVADLKQGDFLIRDEGEARRAVAFANETLPLDVVLLCEFVPVPPDGKYLQNFSRPPDIPSQTSRNRAATQAFQYFSHMNMNSTAQALKGLRPEDRAAVISFGLDPQVEQPLTSDPAEIAAALQRIGRRSGPTVSGAQFMAIEWALRLLAKEQPKGKDPLRRSAILMVSRRYPVYSPAMFNDEPAIFRLWEENTVLSAIVTPGTPSGVHVSPPQPGSSHYRMENMGHIAAETGGSAVYAPTDDFPDLLAMVRSSYSLWFRPSEAKHGAVRRITVELTEEAKKRHPGAEIHARKGYVVR